MKILQLSIIIAILSIFLLVSCDNYKFKNIIGNYYLVKSETQSDIYSLNYDHNGGYPCVINSNVVAIGFDENFLLVKQDVDTINNFYIILHPLKTKSNPRDIEYKIGPLNRIELKNKREELAIPDTISLYSIQ